MKFATASAVAALAGMAAAAKDQRTFAVLRFNNKQLVTARADPIVSPGKTASHVHVVLGGSNFGLSSTGETLKNSKCSTAMVKGDNSNYWFPLLYFQDPKNHKFEPVEVFYSNAYYFFEPTNDDIKAFPLGLQILTGDLNERLPPAAGSITNLDPSKGPIQNVKFTCPRNNNNYDNPLLGLPTPMAPWPGEGVGFPDVDCDGYASPLRMDIHYPSCYNPKAGLTNYKENMAFPSDAGNGKSDCPKGWIHVPHLFLEVYWNTPLFNGRWDQGKGTQPFVFANGDATGYSAHADFMSGWDEPLLQHIIDTCNTGTGGMDTCPGLTYGLNKGDCTIASPVNEIVEGVLSALPGNNPVTGWQYGSGGQNYPAPPRNGDSGSSASTSAAPTKPAATSSNPAASASSPAYSAPVYSPPAQSAPANSGKPSKPSSTQVAGTRTAESNPSSYPTPSAPAPSDSLPAECSGKVHTVWQTVTVTAGSPAAPTGAPSQNSTTVSGFKSAGCFKDNINRALSGDVLPNLGPMTNAKCIAHCKSSGFALAATEYGGQCYCGNELVGSAKLEDSACNVACEGDSSDICGGGWALSVYSEDGEASLKSAKVRRALGHLHQHRSNRH
ncbi:Xylosyltransferase oxt [Cladobotryum mycophilum]|uniref:Xylosyltransferase oxt n=1 Tax=Cladobotryum mycophilum TaxID=491253 RepID=A0ABR0SDF0_9HYPO